MNYAVPAADHLQRGVCEFLRAADSYDIAYRAAFNYHAETVVPRLTVPTVVTACDGDPLQAHLDRLEDSGSPVSIIKSASHADAMELCLNHVTENPGTSVGEMPATEPVDGRLWNLLVEHEAGLSRVRRGGAASGTPVLVLHGAGGSSATVDFLTLQVAEKGPVLAIDLPGHGDSAYEPDDEHSAAGISASVAAVINTLDQLGVNTVRVIAVEGGCSIGVELATRAAARIEKMLLINVPDFDADTCEQFFEKGMPALEPNWFGGHLHEAWNMVRDSRLFFPWFRTDPGGIIAGEPDLDNRRIQLEVTELFKAAGAWQKLLGEQMQYPLRDKLRLVSTPVVCCVSDASPYLEMTRAIASDTGKPFETLPSQRSDFASAVAQLIVGQDD